MKTIRVAVAVIVNSKGEILVTQRFDPSSPETHLKWQLPGGGIDKNETLHEACLREAKEETGFTIKLTSQKPYIIPVVIGNHELILSGFSARPISGTISVEKDVETNDAKWLSRKEIAKLATLEKTLEMIDGCV